MRESTIEREENIGALSAGRDFAFGATRSELERIHHFLWTMPFYDGACGEEAEPEDREPWLADRIAVRVASDIKGKQLTDEEAAEFWSVEAFGQRHPWGIFGPTAPYGRLLFTFLQGADENFQAIQD
jgi:hypothetical protein